MKSDRVKKWSVMIFAMIAGSTLLFTGCGNQSTGDENSEQNALSTYTIEVLTEGGMALEEVGVYVYEDETQNELATVGETDDDGKFVFESSSSANQVIVLKDVPLGYVVEETYPIEGENTQIKLTAELLSMDEIQGVTFDLGDVFVDMSVEAVDGNTYTISELLKEKKAVILNFWYLNCEPCKTEFPFLQESYEKHTDKLELIALNPVDGTKETVAAFQEENKLTFPMAACGIEWEKAMELVAYPTTVVIDRYGTIAFMHKGSITETETFDLIFEYFTAEDYKQVAVKNLKDLK